MSSNENKLDKTIRKRTWFKTLIFYKHLFTVRILLQSTQEYLSLHCLFFLLDCVFSFFISQLFEQITTVKRHIFLIFVDRPLQKNNSKIKRRNSASV